MKLALCQLRVTDDKKENIKNAYGMLVQARERGAEMAILPEMFCISYKSELFRDAAEQVPYGECGIMLRDAAAGLGMTVVGGSVPEIAADGLVYNTSMCFSKSGRLLGVYRKAHLFDVDYDGMHFRESNNIARGSEPPLLFDDGVKAAVEICFDIRFPEWAAYAREHGADILCLPAAFARKTGKAHWELLLRARALDNQMFVAGVAPATCSFSHGHSMICSPTGEVLCDLGTEECVHVEELPTESLDRIREEIPLRRSRIWL